jgi:hypothetical protein
MKRKTTPRDESKLQDLRAKALRRADKLANTLRKLAVKEDPNDVLVEPLLKELEQALPRLRRRVERVTGKTGHELAVPPKSRSRKAKRQSASASSVAE